MGYTVQPFLQQVVSQTICKTAYSAPFESAILHMLGDLILPLLQQVGWHDNEGGLDGHSLTFVMCVLVQVLHRPGSRRRVGQYQHQALQCFAQSLYQQQKM